MGIRDRFFNRKAQRRFKAGDNVWCVKHVPRLPKSENGETVKKQTEMLDQLVIIGPTALFGADPERSNAYEAKRVHDGAIQVIYDGELTGEPPKYAVGEEVQMIYREDRFGTVVELAGYHGTQQEWRYSIMDADGDYDVVFESRLQPVDKVETPTQEELEQWYREGRRS